MPNLFVVFAGTGAEWSGDPDLIWSHSWDLTEGTGMDRGDLTVDGVKINNYAMMPEVGGDLTGYTGVVSGPTRPRSASTRTSTATCWACPTSTTTATSPTAPASTA